MSKPTLRNRLAHQIANLAIRYIADDDYEADLEWIYVYGLRSLSWNSQYHVAAPPALPDESWRRFDTTTKP